VTAGLEAARLHAVIGSSLRLREEIIGELLAPWQGPIKRANDPEDLQHITLDLGTPSLFSEPALWIVRMSTPYARKHRAELLPLAEAGLLGPGLVLALNEIDRKDDLAKLLAKSAAVHIAEGPEPREIHGWLSARLAKVPQGVERAHQVAEALISHIGENVDGLLSAIETVAAYCGDKPLTVSAVEDLCGGTAERPIWEFTGAFFSGDARRALELLHGGGGMEASQALAGLINEARKMLACEETDNDADASAWSGGRGRGNLYHSRNRARALGKSLLLRLMNGFVQTQRKLRQTGHDHELVLEMLVLHAQRIIRTAVR
jgi:DNA polymerase III delta subunit